MTAIKKVIRLLLILSGILFLGKILPTILNIPRPHTLFKSLNLTAPQKIGKPVPEKPPSSGRSQWPLELLDSLKNRFPDSAVVIEAPEKDTSFVYFPRGKAMEEYVLEIFRLCRKLNIKVIEGRVVHTRTNSVKLLLEKGGQWLTVFCRHRARTYLPGYAGLSVIITGLDSVQQEDLMFLSGLKWRKSLVINPFSENNGLMLFAKAAENDEILILLPLEPAAYPYRNPGKGTLLINYSEKKVSSLLTEKLSLLTNGKGFATAFGSRAIEHREILRNIFRFCAEHRMAFLDLTGCQRSLSTQTAQPAGVLCRKSTEIRNTANLTDHLTAKIHSAKNTGESLIVIRYSRSSIRILDRIISDALKRDKGLVLKTFSELDLY